MAFITLVGLTVVMAGAPAYLTEKYRVRHSIVAVAIFLALYVAVAAL